MPDIVFNVLFLCTGNSARSIMAEAILNRVGQGRFHAYSAGSRPRDSLHPYARELLEKLNYDVSGLFPKSWLEFTLASAPRLDFVFTVCEEEVGEPCPAWPGRPMMAHWGAPDPVQAAGKEAERRYAFADAYRMLHNRIAVFAHLPVRKLDQMSLQRQLDAIGRTQDAAQLAEAV